MNKFMQAVKAANNYTYTENGALTHKSTLDTLYDLFAMGGAYRNRSENDCIVLFKQAFDADAANALKCLFYLRDIRGGQGERRFFRVVMKWFANEYPETAIKNFPNIVEMGRWDDFYTFVGTKVEKDAFKFLYKQLALDVQCKTPSLLAKWLKSENTSSADSRHLATLTRNYFQMTSRQYRKTLSILRERIKVLEVLMSENRWDEIEFDKIPSKAGFKYRNAFARRDIIKAKYEAFAKDENTKVNAKTLYPYEVVAEAITEIYNRKYTSFDDTNRLMINKYWDNLADYIKNAKFNGIAVVDTSGSMAGTPMNVAISLGMYCAEKAQGPYHNHFFTFSSTPQFMEIKGIDFCDKVTRILRAPWGFNTNIKAVFDQMLNIAASNHLSQSEIPQNLIVISDMEFDRCGGLNIGTLMETIEREWLCYGYSLPRIVFWNVDARQDNIPMRDNGRVTYVSGFSPVLFEQIMQNKSGKDLMMDKLNSDRYKSIIL